MENTKSKNQSQNNTSPIDKEAENQQSTFGSKREKQTNNYDIENQPGYQNQYQSGVDDAPEQAMQSNGGMNQIGQKDDKSYDPETEERSNVQEANDDVLTKGHVVTNDQEEGFRKSDREKNLRTDVDNDGTTTEGRGR